MFGLRQYLRDPKGPAVKPNMMKKFWHMDSRPSSGLDESRVVVGARSDWSQCGSRDYSRVIRQTTHSDSVLRSHDTKAIDTWAFFLRFSKNQNTLRLFESKRKVQFKISIISG
jgi:hypothetical protein